MLAPDRVVRLMTPPLKRPNSAGGLFVSTLNSCIASTTGKNATCPGSGCSTEMPSNRYSLVRGRPPLMRGRSEPGGSATPGVSAASVMKRTAVQRQRRDGLGWNDRSKSGRRAKQRHLASHHHRFADPHRQIDIESNRQPGLDAYTLVSNRLETLHDHVEPVRAGRQTRQRVDARRRRHRLPRARGLTMCRRHDGAGKRRAARIRYDACDGTSADLKKPGRRPHQEADRQRHVGDCRTS